MPPPPQWNRRHVLPQPHTRGPRCYLGLGVGPAVIWRLITALKATLRFCPVLATESEGRLAAIVDFTFNLGAGRLQASTLRRRVNVRDWSSSAIELRRWVYGGGKVLPGLVIRREAEVALVL